MSSASPEEDDDYGLPPLPPKKVKRKSQKKVVKQKILEPFPIFDHEMEAAMPGTNPTATNSSPAPHHKVFASDLEMGSNYLRDHSQEEGFPGAREENNPVLKGLRSALGSFIVSETRADDTAEAFFAKVMSFIVAEMASKTAAELFKSIFSSGGMNKDHAELIGQAIYAVLNTFFTVIMVWLLRDVQPGHGICSDALRLWRASGTVLIAWGWKDLVADIEKLGGFSWTVIVASVLTVLIVGLQLPRYYAVAKAAVAAGGKEDTLAMRFAALPGSLGLTLGFAWNKVATFGVDELQAMANTIHVNFFIQAVYSLVMGLLVQNITRIIGRQLRDMKKNGAQDTAIARRALLAVSVSIAFLQAWALLDVCNEFFFTVLWGCSSCDYQTHFIFACAITFLFVKIAYVLKLIDDDDADSETLEALNINSMMLTTGWAWKGFFGAWETAILGQSTGWESFGKALVTFCVILLMCVTIFHWALAVRRTKDKMRKQTKALINLGTEQQSAPELPHPLPPSPPAHSPPASDSTAASGNEAPSSQLPEQGKRERE